jgi:hypothetical protein
MMQKKTMLLCMLLASVLWLVQQPRQVLGKTQIVTFSMTATKAAEPRLRNLTTMVWTSTEMQEE